MLSFRITTLWRNSLSFKSQIIPCSESVVGAGRRKWPSPVQGLMGTLQPVRRIHTSRPRYLNPIIVAVLRPLSKMVAVLVGRGFRKWWQSLPKKKKDIFIQHFIRNKFRYLGGSTMLGLAGYTYYESHVTTTPFTRRRRFMVFTPDQLFKIAQSCYQVSGDIVMFRGMMDLLENEDQVAFVLAHEMSHAILEHSAEQLSHGYLLDVLILMPLAVIWAFIPSDGLAVVTHWFLNQVVQVLLQLPYSRSLENEADCVGLRLAAKACFDVREASAFWGQMSVMDKLREARGEVGEEPAWLSTHPSHSDRQEMLDYQMSEALMLREACQCPRLTKSDPRHSIWMLQKNLIHTSSKQSPQESSGPDHKIRTREPAKIQ
ncbi:metalloendopeptidase OMA1, mitochondrial-like isoform X2 [Homarus americanus]|uniref:metalloendopeptidase OMA1, mitochondrial-like isoform X2 n=1 Tax=Homarus americanus TaxID=6706 RepID=UPI001C451A62|nr:metalloendopeptidase OMA1, mitochondrial-like isoform X2 [Homarus americanus]